MHIAHHGATRGVTGSCHQLSLADGRSVLIDCGLFQGAETSQDGAGAGQLAVQFSLHGVAALIVTHVHIDHVGRIPYLLEAGFDGPIVCSQASAELLPLVLEDAMEIGFGSERHRVAPLLARLRQRIVPLHYKQWHLLLPPGPADAAGAAGVAEGVAAGVAAGSACSLRLRLQPAGHILGSAYVELDVAEPGQGPAQRVVFSGDLGAPYTPLLPAPSAPVAADVLVLESTYGDRRHEPRKERRQRLQALCEHAFNNGGTVLIPAFSIGRTQELLCELEDIIHRNRQRAAAPGRAWENITIVVDSPLAADFTRGYARLKAHWDVEARTHLAEGRHPLDFAQLKTVGSHDLHLRIVRHLAQSHEPAIVIAASGMCSGGRIVNYLKAMLEDPRHDILFCGYQAAGTPGRHIQQQAGRPGAQVMLDGEAFAVRAQVHTLGGYSAHADQQDLLNFVGRMQRKPKLVRLVHGDEGAKARLAELLRQQQPGLEVGVP